MVLLACSLMPPVSAPWLLPVHLTSCARRVSRTPECTPGPTLSTLSHLDVVIPAKALFSHKATVTGTGVRTSELITLGSTSPSLQLVCKCWWKEMKTAAPFKTHWCGETQPPQRQAFSGCYFTNLFGYKHLSAPPTRPHVKRASARRTVCGHARCRGCWLSCIADWKQGQTDLPTLEMKDFFSRIIAA